MPITINGQKIHKLNGPATIVCLKPVSSSPNTNGERYIMLFGDVHKQDNFQHCFNEPDCVELIQQFIPILDEYAAGMSTEFYVERFMNPELLDPNEKKTKHYHNSFEQMQRMYDVMHDIKNFERMSPNTGKKVLENRKLEMMKTFRKEMLLNKRSQSSNLIDIFDIFETCFYHKTYKNTHCKYKNIKWQFADPRQLKDRNFNILNFTQDIDSMFDMYKAFLPSKNKKAKIFQNIQELFYDRTDMKDILQTIKLCATDTNEFVRRIYNTRLMQKQLLHLPSSVFTEESFRSIASVYFDMFKAYDKTDLVKILDILLKYADIHDEDNEDVNNPALQQILQELSEIELTPELALQYSYVPMGMICIVLDMYFILRMNKHDSNTAIPSRAEGRETTGPSRPDLSNKKLVVGYFGSSHVDRIKHYFVNIVKTHEIVFEHNTEDEAGGLRRINITADVDLDAFASSSLGKTEGGVTIGRTRSKSKSKSNSHTRSRSKSKSKSK